MSLLGRWASLALIAIGVACAGRPPAPAAGAKIALPFIENDFAHAMTKAREANLPLFVEVWAPW